MPDTLSIESPQPAPSRNIVSWEEALLTDQQNAENAARQTLEAIQPTPNVEPEEPTAPDTLEVLPEPSSDETQEAPSEPAPPTSTTPSHIPTTATSDDALEQLAAQLAEQN